MSSDDGELLQLPGLQSRKEYDDLIMRLGAKLTYYTTTMVSQRLMKKIVDRNKAMFVF